MSVEKQLGLFGDEPEPAGPGAFGPAGAVAEPAPLAAPGGDSRVRGPSAVACVPTPPLTPPLSKGRGIPARRDRRQQGPPDDAEVDTAADAEGGTEADARKPFPPLLRGGQGGWAARDDRSPALVEAADTAADAAPPEEPRDYSGELHHCGWPGCTEGVPAMHWGCLPHYWCLPKDVRNALYPRQETAAEYQAALRAADAWIAKTLRPTTGATS